MLHLYVLYACVYFTSKNPAPRAGQTRCVEKQVFFDADQCKREIPKPGRLTDKSRHSRSWLECEETRADSWIPADANAPGTHLYEASASVSDANAMAALLAPLSPQARATLGPGDLEHSFGRAFEGPGSFSFFVVGTGSKVIAFAVTHLDDFQFAQVAADVSSSSQDMKTDKDLDFATIAEDAGIKLSYHSEMPRRDMPPPGGMEAEP